MKAEGAAFYMTPGERSFHAIVPWVQGITMPDGRAPSLDSLDRLPGLLSDPDRSPGRTETVVGLQVRWRQYLLGLQVGRRQ